jgi:hypothetical protein
VFTENGLDRIRSIQSQCQVFLGTHPARQYFIIRKISPVMFVAYGNQCLYSAVVLAISVQRNEISVGMYRVVFWRRWVRALCHISYKCLAQLVALWI